MLNSELSLNERSSCGRYLIGDDKRDMYQYRSIGNLSTDPWYIKLKEIYNSAQTEMPGIEISITGGYCRDILFNTKHTTDIDIITNYIPDDLARFLKDKLGYQTVDDNPCNFYIGDTTMHIIEGHRSLIEGQFHAVVPYKMFDFTVNTACLSLRNGDLLIQPITLFDIKHRVLRNNRSSEDEINTNFDIKEMFRAIRFMLKYDMKMHSTVANNIKSILYIQDKLKETDEIDIHHSIKHMYDEEESLRIKFFEILQTLNFMDTNRFPNFDKYFKYIESKWKNGKSNKIPVVLSQRFQGY